MSEKFWVWIRTSNVTKNKFLALQKHHQLRLQEPVPRSLLKKKRREGGWEALFWRDDTHLSFFGRHDSVECCGLEGEGMEGLMEGEQRSCGSPTFPRRCCRIRGLPPAPGPSVQPGSPHRSPPAVSSLSLTGPRVALPACLLALPTYRGY